MKLNLKQKKILKLLSINCRFTNKDIAKSVRLSEDAVRYQIDKLIKEERLGFFNTQFVHLNLGYSSYHHWIRLPKKVPIDKIKEIPNVNSVNSSFGKFDYQILSYAKTKKQLKETIKRIKSLKPQEYKFSELIDLNKSFTNVIPSINIEVKIPNNPRKFEYELSDESYALPIKDIQTKLDKVDKKIIKVLIKSPRASYQEIHEETDINHETIRYRMKRYVKERLINNFGLIHDFKKYGLYSSYILYKAKNLNNEELKQYLEHNKNIMYGPKLKGDYDGIIYVLSENPTELGKIYAEIIDIIGSSLQEVDLIIWDKIHKYVQFPEKELN